MNSRRARGRPSSLRSPSVSVERSSFAGGRSRAAGCATVFVMALTGSLLVASVAAAAPPELDADPFRPPPGRQVRPDRSPPTPPPRRWWFVRPEVGFVARLSRDRALVPKEGFGFGIQAGAVLGSGLLRFALSLRYGFHRVARAVDTQFDSGNLTACSDVRSVSYHIATASLLGWLELKSVAIWMGVHGGFAYAQLHAPTASCGVSEADAPTGTVGPDVGVAYRLRPDLWLGVYFRSLHFFSDRTWHSEEADADYRLFYPLLATGVSLTLRF